MPIEVEKTGKPERSLISVGINDKTAQEMTDEGNRKVLKTEKGNKDNQKRIKREKSDQDRDRNQGLFNRIVVQKVPKGSPKQTTTVVETEDTAQEYEDTTPGPQAALDENWNCSPLHCKSVRWDSSDIFN